MKTIKRLMHVFIGVLLIKAKRSFQALEKLSLRGLGNILMSVSLVMLISCSDGLHNDENAVANVQEPPGLDVLIGETWNEAKRGTYSWQFKNDDESFTQTEADSLHPLLCKERMKQFETSEKTVILRFTEEPDAVSVCCWSDEYWSDITADSENVSVSGDEIELKQGGYIYEVTAKWDTEKNGNGGTAHYSFYAKVLE